LPVLDPSAFYMFPKLKPSFLVDVLKAMKVSWRRAVSIDVKGDYFEK
jgi:hypothetical protein